MVYCLRMVVSHYNYTGWTLLCWAVFSPLAIVRYHHSPRQCFIAPCKQWAAGPCPPADYWKDLHYLRSLQALWWAELLWILLNGMFRFWCPTSARRLLWSNRSQRLAWWHRYRPYSLWRNLNVELHAVMIRLPTHLQDLRDLDGTQQRQLASVLLQYLDLFPVPGSTLTDHIDAVEHEIDTGHSTPNIRCDPAGCRLRKSKRKRNASPTCWPVDKLNEVTAHGWHWLSWWRKKTAVPGSVWTTVIWTLRLSSTPTYCPGSTIRWICWSVSNGSSSWIWPADIGRFHCLRKPGLRQHSRHTRVYFNSKLLG